MFTPDVDYVYIPNNRVQGNQTRLREFLELYLPMLASIKKNSPNCFNPLSRALCVHYYLPCGSNTTLHVPQFLCPEVCNHIVNDVCSEHWDSLVESVRGSSESGVDLPVCNDTSKIINFLQLSVDCCSSTEIVSSSSDTTSSPSPDSTSVPITLSASFSSDAISAISPDSATTNASSSPDTTIGATPTSAPTTNTVILAISTSFGVGFVFLLIGIFIGCLLMFLLWQRRRKTLQLQNFTERCHLLCAYNLYSLICLIL